MPQEWLVILSAENPLATLYELENLYTVADCYNLMEIMEAKAFISSLTQKE